MPGPVRPPATIFRHVVFEPDAGSTNDVVMGHADAGAEEGLVVAAESQSAGRGRHGRTWFSPPGKNIYMSLLLRPGVPVGDASLLTLMAGVGVCDVLREHAGIDARLKWPNDVVLAGKKLGGILIETKVEDARVAVAVIGIGININMASGDIPDDIQDIATSVRIATGKEHDRREIIGSVLKRIDAWYGKVFHPSGRAHRRIIPREKARLVTRWKELDTVLGRRISVTTSRGVLSGIARDIDENGVLRLEGDSGRMETIHTGDIAFQ